MEVLVHRHDEDEMEGTMFLTVREAIDHMKSRAKAEGKAWNDYLIKPIEQNV